MASPLWVTELVPTKGRGILTGITGLLGVIDYIVAAYVGLVSPITKPTTSGQWQAPIALGCFPLLLCIIY